jgi:subtilisin family serine protease
MRAFAILLVLALGDARAHAALRLDLPVRVPGAASEIGAAGAVAGAAYRGNVVELRLSPTATRVAAARTAGLMRSDALGVSAVDRLAGRLGGVWFEPLFPGEAPPPENSDQPDFTAFYLAHLAPGVPLAEALERFGALGEVVSADPIAILPVDAVPNDSLFTTSAWYYQPGARRDIHAPEAWDVTVGDTAIVVAVLDTGVLPYHPDLGGTVAGLPGQIWTNWIEAAGSAGVDDDGNGYVDDVHGWDFVTGFTDGLPGEDDDVEDNDPNDFVGHGTAVAGLVGALTDNGIGVAGAAWRVRIMPVRMGYGATCDGCQGGVVEMSFAARAIRYATRMRANVINCSWASANTDGIDAAVTAAVGAGITVVSAAGNSNPFHYLGDRDDVLAIAATDSTDRIAAFSNRGKYVDLAAPGVAIRSTWSAQYQPTYLAASGTSFSAPLVAGAAALLQSRQIPPHAPRLLTPRGVQLRLMEGADDISAPNPTLAGLYGAGRLNAFRAIDQTSGSSATRTRSRSIGAPVLLSTNANPHAAFLTVNRRLVELDAVTQDTVMSVITVGGPTGNLAAVDLGGTVGIALFYATEADGVFGFAASNGTLPGAWPQAGSAPAIMYGPGLGDLDGDGAVEVVSGGDDGQLWAWAADGTPVAGYPIATGVSPLGAGPALFDLDGVPGVEVVIAAGDGTVHAFGAGGVALAGWPVTVAASPRAPVIGRIGSEVAVVIAAGNQLHALSPAGLARPGFPVSLSGTASQDPALADLDGDGHDEIIVITESPNRIEVRDSLGLSLSALNWPRPLSAPAQGPPVLGELSVGSPGPELLIHRGGELLALEHDGDSLVTFPKPGGAGAAPSLGQADRDAAAEVIAGTGGDMNFYIYDGGSGASAAGEFPWPTARGNFARTGSRLYSPSTGTLDEVPPDAVADLGTGAITATSIELRWSAPGDDGPLGRASSYDIRRASFPLNDANFALGTAVPGAPIPGVEGAAESAIVSGLGEGAVWHFGIRSTDRAGNTSAMSNPLQSATSTGAPGQVQDLRVVARTDSSISFEWTATGDDGSVGRPRRYAVRGAFAPLDEATFVTAPVTWVMTATVDAGGTEHLVFPGLTAATRYWFGLKAVDEAGNTSLLSNVVEVQTEVGGPLAGRVGIALGVAPQPSRGLAEFFWQASGNGEGQRQTLHLFDVTGRRLRVLDLGTGVGGRVKWDGRDAEGHSVPAGLYYARLLSGSFHTQTRLVLLP